MMAKHGDPARLARWRRSLDVICEVANAHAVRATFLWSRHRSPPLVAARRDAARRLAALGYAPREIGNVMNRSRSTVRALLGGAS